MIPQLVSAEYVKEHTIHVRFADGAEGDVDFSSELWGEVFEPLKDPLVFREFRLERELNTLCWPSGADVAPEFLYAKVAHRAAAARPAPKRR